MAEYYEDDDVAVGPLGALGRVRHVSDDGRLLTIELRGGQVATATSNEPTELAVGNVVIVRDRSLDRAPDELWTDQTWVGVVKVKRADRTVVDSGGRWQLVPTNGAVDYSVGNTVEVQDSVGVVEVLHPDPIRLVEFGELDESVEGSSLRRRRGRRRSTTSADFQTSSHELAS